MKLKPLLKPRKTVLFLDGNNYIHKGHWAVKPMKNHKGLPTNAIVGFFNMLFLDVSIIKPTHLVVAFDMYGRNWRRDIYEDYKANRRTEVGALVDPVKQLEMDNLYKQCDLIKPLLKAIGFRITGIPGQEADDIIGTLATNFSENDFLVYISSADKDFAQLVDDKIFLYDRNTKEKLGIQGIKHKFGVYPNEFIEYLALVGDTVDNIPGVTGVAGKTASKLIAEHKTLKGIVEAAESFTPALKKNILLAKDQFKMTKSIIAIKRDIPLNTTHRSSGMPIVLKDPLEVKKLCKELGLNSLYSKLMAMYGE